MLEKSFFGEAQNFAAGKNQVVGHPKFRRAASHRAVCEGFALVTITTPYRLNKWIDLHREGRPQHSS
jgi:hypothetical protein